MNIFKSLILGLCLCASATATEAEALSQEQRAAIDTILKSNDTVVLATITDMDGPSFIISHMSGRPADSDGPNGASSESTVYTYSATVLKALKGEITTPKIRFELATTVDGKDQAVRVKSLVHGSTHVLVFRREFKPKDGVTEFAWDEPTYWPQDSPEAKFILESLAK